MNKIEKLIKEMCPNGVEYKKIKEFSNMFNGMNGVSNKWKDSGNCKFIDYMNCFKNFRIDVSKIHNATVKKLTQNQILYNDILFTASSETKDECCISGVIDNEIPKNIFLDDHLFLIRIFEKFKNEINSIFLNYYFHSISFRNDVNKIVRGLTRFYVSKIDFMEIQIPIPPIEIQNEIVKILDTFTQLEAELEAELEARDKQYQYYRNKLLDFDNNQKLLQKLFEKDNKEIDNSIEWKCLSEVFEIKNGFTPSKNNSELWKNGTIPWFKLDDIRSNGNILFDSKIKVNSKAIINKEPFKENSIIISTTATIGEHALIKCKFICNQQFTIFSLNNVYEKLMNPKFIFYYFFNISNVLKNKTKNINLPIINIKEIKNMSIPIPSLEIQIKIVNILDKLQDYSKDIKTGLPLEIEQRQNQYEYYRDLLLDFKDNAQGGALANSYIEMLNWIEQKLLYSLEYKKLWELVNFDKKFNNVAKYKQDEILYFVHISAKKLKEYKLNSNGDVKILSTGNYEGFTNYIQNDSNINYGEIISIPSGGSPILKYYKGYFIDSLNILFSSKNRSKINLKFIYYFLINNIFFIEENFRGSSIKHPNMSTIIEINIPLPSIEVQNKIVNILDRLQDYSKDIKTGLPLEIEQRQKQYEYYRNLFLNLKKQDL